MVVEIDIYVSMNSNVCVLNLRPFLAYVLIEDQFYIKIVELVSYTERLLKLKF